MKIRLMQPMESVTVLDGDGNAITVMMGMDGKLDVIRGLTEEVSYADAYATHDTTPITFYRKCWNREPHLLSECREPRDGIVERLR